MIAGIISEKPAARWAFRFFCITLSTVIQPKQNKQDRYNERVSSASLQASDQSSVPPDTALRRAGWFTLLLLLINLIGDGWAGRPGPLAHQLLLLPFTAMFAWGLIQLVRPVPSATPLRWSPRRALKLAILLEAGAIALYFYEGHHFAHLGYQAHPVLALIVFAMSLIVLAVIAFGRNLLPGRVVAGTLVIYTAGLLLAIRGFPVTYLRSDMLPVILWADQNLLRHLSPYTTMYVGTRVYDFPYLPGMILAYLPFTALHLDIRWGSLAYVLGVAVLTYGAARRERKLEVATLLALFLLGPFLQFRHEIYLQPHWFTLIAAYVLMVRRRYAWAALVFGVSMAIYQFSWILFPFVLLFALRRRGWLEVCKLGLLGGLGALLVVGPFLRTALHRITNNTVGQWGRMARHASAEPINLSYWITYAVPTHQLLRFQAVAMIAIFLWCFFRGYCSTLADTLRWMLVALTIFVACNVLVDGYFYLMVLVVMMAYVCVANGWWEERQLVTTEE